MEPNGRIPPQLWMRAPETQAVLSALQASGTTVRFVGGCVRDAVLGQQVSDIDIATPDRPETVMNLLEKAGLKAVPTGLQHGTVTAVADHQPFEITTLREDVDTDGRRAHVAFTESWIADAARRDFTMNAMFCEADGTLYDPFGGWADLLAGLVRFVGDPDQRIAEDYLRILRFFRFHARYGMGAPDPAGLAAAEHHAPRLATLSGERVRDEILKLLCACRPVGTVAVLRDRCILEHVLPFPIRVARLNALVCLEQELGETPDGLRRLAATFAIDVGAVPRMASSLRLSKQQSQRLLRLASLDPAEVPTAPGHALRVKLYREGAVAMRDAVFMAFASHWQSEEALEITALEAVLSAIRDWTPKRLPIDGADVQAAGVPEGPDVGRYLKAVEAWWLARDFEPGRAACLACLQMLCQNGAALGDRLWPGG